MNRSYFVMLVLFLAVVLGAFAVNGVGLAAYVDMPSLGIVLAPAILMSFAGHSPREIGRSYRVAFSSCGTSRAELESALAYFDGLGRYLGLGGVLGIVTGAIAILASVTNLENVGRGFALALLSVLYAIILVFVVAIPFRTAIRKRLAILAES